MYTRHLQAPLNYITFYRPLEWLVERGLTNRMLVVKRGAQFTRQLKGIYAVKSPRIILLYTRVVKLVENFKLIKFD